MKKEKQICDFNIKKFNTKKRTDVERAPRPTGGGSQKGKPSRGDTTAPTISNISVSNITDTTATLSWTTSEECTCTIQYGTTVAYGLTKTTVSGLTHFAILTGLTGNTSYNFKIVATDLVGNITNSSNSSFLTVGIVPKLIYLEFYGTTVSGTMWNSSGVITAEHSGLTEAEIDSILATIQEYFSDFNVIITNDILLYNTTSTAIKQRVVFTETNEWYSNNVGGVSYINSFGWADQSPAWVFTKLLNYNVHNITEAGTHEIGHMLGLRHQVLCQNGTVTNQYNPGDGINAPIMGVSYNVPSGSWWVGPNSLGCSNIQDDVQMITNKLGLKL